MPVLLALFGPKRGVRLEIGEGANGAKEAVLGRSSEADLQLVDAKVSRQHCRFVVRMGVLEVEDLGSNNGTYVNGERIAKPRRLAPGDEIAVGDSLFLVDGGDGADAAAARFGDATLIVAPGGAASRVAVATPPAAEDRPNQVAALALRLRDCPDVERSAAAVLDAIETALAAKRCFVLQWDDERKLVRPLAGRATDGVVAVSRALLDAAAKRRRGLAVADAASDGVRASRSVQRHQLRAVAIAPILAGSRIVGFLHADRAAPGYTAADASLLESFAALFALGGHLPGPPVATRDDAEVPVGTSPAWREALRIAAACAAAPSTVLITGESGTGKEELARFIHRGGPRATGPFVAVNCGAIPEALAESELFGHEKGAFTGAVATRVGSIEAADGGTLFLDEVGELPPALQVKLLRVLQERVLARVGSTVPRRVDLRVVAATHRDLEADVRDGRFREDLFYRLAVIRLPVPPLRERPDDVAALVTALLARIAARIGRRPPTVAPGAVKLLRGWRWPGNVRELANVLERVLVLRGPERGGALEDDEIAAALGDGPRPAPAGGGTQARTGTLAEKVAALERAEIEAAMRKARGVKSRAAQALGVSRPTLDKKLAELGIDLWR